VAKPISRIFPATAPKRPIIVVGCPRSGTSVLRQLFLQSAELRSVQSEGHILWDAYHHPRDRGWDSDELTAADVHARERAYVYTAIRLWVRGGRFIDKTPESCLRIPYLDALFPDATFVFLRRRAADNVNSLMEGWRARPRFVKYELPEPLQGIAPLDGERWSFVLVPGWRALGNAPLEEVCARQYVSCNDAVLDARATIDPARWLDVAYEDLVASTLEETSRLFDALGVELTPAVEEFAASLDRRPAATAITPPKPDKWREQNPLEIKRILPLVEKTERRLGYAS
jgi:hypothetical protein